MSAAPDPDRAVEVIGELLDKTPRQAAHDRAAAKRSLRESLRLNAEKVAVWPAYLRVHSSAYYKAKARRG